MFNKVIKQFKENSKLIEQSNELKPLINILKDIPLIKLPNTNSLNEDTTNNVKHFIIHQEDEHQFIKNIHSKWNQLISKQPNLLMWILLSIFILSSVLLSCKFLII